MEGFHKLQKLSEDSESLKDIICTTLHKYERLWEKPGSLNDNI